MENAIMLKAVIENAIDGIITINTEGIVQSINPSATHLFGYVPDEVIGENISMLMPEPDKSRHDEYLKRYHRTGVPRIIGIGREVTGLRKDGSVFPFRLAISEVNLEDRRMYAGFIHDLSEQKIAESQLKDYTNKLELLVEERTTALKKMVQKLQDASAEVSQSLEKEKELNQMKSRFVSMASHEFRTPLSAIQLSASLIDKYALTYLNPNISKHISKIKNSVGNLTTILNDFLSIERLETGIITPHFFKLNLVEFAEEIAEEMQMIAKQNQSIIYLHTGVESTIKTDASLLKHCIVNLISNAIKYSGENTFIEFNTEIGANFFSVTVKDNGIGIPLTEQKHLFDAFFRAHNTGSIPGTGLGLNIVKRYTKLMNGKVTFESAENKDTTFTLHFKKEV